jgi:hypothetical protein
LNNSHESFYDFSGFLGKEVDVIAGRGCCG